MAVPRRDHRADPSAWRRRSLLPAERKSLGQVAQFALEFLQPVIHTFDVAGPEFRIILSGGPPNTDAPLQGRLLLH
jgi:hypothetical protein